LKNQKNGIEKVKLHNKLAQPKALEAHSGRYGNPSHSPTTGLGPRNGA